MSLKDTKILIPEIPGEWTQRIRDGSTNIWNDSRHHRLAGLPEVRLEPPIQGLHAERIDGAWYWVCGCERCLESGKLFNYITCEEHDKCVTCKCTRAEITETPWWAMGGGWRCKPCQSRMDEARKTEALMAATAKGHSEDDCCYTDVILCPYCAAERDADELHDCAKGLVCGTCDGVFDLEVEWTPSYTTTKAK